MGAGGGSGLLRRAEAAMRSHNHFEAVLWVLAGNSRAHKFYRSAGWSLDGVERTTSHLVGSPLEELRFHKTLVVRAQALTR